MQKHFIEYRIENTNLCGYRCVMCPREKQSRKLGFMSVEDFKLILSKLPLDQKADIHLHGYGEPILDPTLPEKIALIKPYPNLTSMIITTLGVELEDEYFEALIKNGLKIILVSLYGFTEESYKTTHRVNRLELVKKNLRTIARLKTKLNSKIIVSIKIQSENFKFSLIQIGGRSKENEAKDAFIKEFKALGFQFQEIKDWHNYGDGRSYNDNLKKVCPVLNGQRSRILNVTWDLNVIPCSFDYDSTMKLGNLRHQSIREIFTSDVYKKFLIAQMNQDYTDYPVCRHCDKGDY